MFPPEKKEVAHQLTPTPMIGHEVNSANGHLEQEQIMVFSSYNHNNNNNNNDRRPFCRSFSANGKLCSAENGAELANGTPAKFLKKTCSDQWPSFKSSEHAKSTINPIRKIVDFMNISPNPTKPLLKLHLGDPTLTGVLPTDPTVLQAVQKALFSGRYNGYGPAVGLLEARRAVANFFTSPQALISADDVIMTSGCSHALQMAIEALANPGDNILVPRPGFPLYTTLMRPHNIEDRQYDLRMDKGIVHKFRHFISGLYDLQSIQS